MFKHAARALSRGRALRRRGDSRLQGGAQLGACRNAELGEDVVEVRPDRAMGEEELLADLAVGEALGGELGDLQFLGCEPVPPVRLMLLAALPGGAQLLARAFAPRKGAKRIAGIPRRAQIRS